MEEEIKEFKRLNGNYIKYTHKELIGALHVKVDKINDRLAKGDVSFAEIQTTIKTHRKAIYGLFGILGTILSGLVLSLLI